MTKKQINKAVAGKDVRPVTSSSDCVLDVRVHSTSDAKRFSREEGKKKTHMNSSSKKTDMLQSTRGKV